MGAKAAVVPGRTGAFALTYAAYAALYMCRKNFSAAKYSIEQEEGVTLVELGMVDSAYLLAYTIGQVPAGMLVDAVGAKWVLVAGLLGCGLCAYLFSMDGRVSTLWWVLCFGVSGFCQCVGPAGNLKVMSSWFSGPSLATAMGWWSTCYQVGGILAAALGGYLVKNHGWRAAFQIPALVVVAVALAIAGMLQDAPAVPVDAAAPAGANANSTGQPPPQEKKSGSGGSGEGAAAPSTSSSTKAATPIRVLLKNPILWMWGCSYFFSKLIRYSFLFWLPFYLRAHFGFDDDIASYTSITLDVGGSVGCILIGYICDYFGASRRPLVCASCMMCLAVTLLCYPSIATAGNVMPLLFVIGATLYAPDSLIVGCVGQDLGGRDGAASACALLNSAGSLGAFVQGAATPLFVEAYGWSRLFVLYGLLSLAAATILVVPYSRARDGTKEV